MNTRGEIAKEIQAIFNETFQSIDEERPDPAFIKAFIDTYHQDLMQVNHQDLETLKHAFQDVLIALTRQLVANGQPASSTIGDVLTHPLYRTFLPDDLSKLDEIYETTLSPDEKIKKQNQDIEEAREAMEHAVMELRTYGESKPKDKNDRDRKEIAKKIVDELPKNDPDFEALLKKRIDYLKRHRFYDSEAIKKQRTFPFGVKKPKEGEKTVAQLLDKLINATEKVLKIQEKLNYSTKAEEINYISLDAMLAKEQREQLRVPLSETEEVNYIPLDARLSQEQREALRDPLRELKDKRIDKRLPIDEEGPQRKHSILNSKSVEGRQYELVGTLDEEEASELLRQVGMEKQGKTKLGEGAWGKVRFLRVYNKGNDNSQLQFNDKGQFYVIKKVKNTVHFENEEQFHQLAAKKSVEGLMLATDSITTVDSKGVKTIYQVQPIANSGSGKELIERLSKLKVEDQTAMLTHVASSLIKSFVNMHDQGMVHRDFKPENFLLDTKSNVVHPYIADFGSAVYYQEGRPILTVAKAFDLRYAPPENQPTDLFDQIAQQNQDAWALGLTLLQLVAASDPRYGQYIQNSFLRWRKESLTRRDPITGKISFSEQYPHELKIQYYEDVLNQLRDEKGWGVIFKTAPTLKPIVLGLLNPIPEKRMELREALDQLNAQDLSKTADVSHVFDTLKTGFEYKEEIADTTLENYGSLNDVQTSTTSKNYDYDSIDNTQATETPKHYGSIDSTQAAEIPKHYGSIDHTQMPEHHETMNYQKTKASDHYKNLSGSSEIEKESTVQHPLFGGVHAQHPSMIKTPEKLIDMAQLNQIEKTINQIKKYISTSKDFLDAERKQRLSHLVDNFDAKLEKGNVTEKQMVNFLKDIDMSLQDKFMQSHHEEGLQLKGKAKSVLGMDTTVIGWVKELQQQVFDLLPAYQSKAYRVKEMLKALENDKKLHKSMELDVEARLSIMIKRFADTDDWNLEKASELDKNINQLLINPFIGQHQRGLTGFLKAKMGMNTPLVKRLKNLQEANNQLMDALKNKEGQHMHFGEKE